MQTVSTTQSAWTAWWRELGHILAMAGPLCLQNTFSYLTAIVSSAFVGHLGPQVLISDESLGQSSRALEQPSR